MLFPWQRSSSVVCPVPSIAVSAVVVPAAVVYLVVCTFSEAEVVHSVESEKTSLLLRHLEVLRKERTNMSWRTSGTSFPEDSNRLMSSPSQETLKLRCPAGVRQRRSHQRPLRGHSWFCPIRETCTDGWCLHPLCKPHRPSRSDRILQTGTDSCGSR